MPRLEIIVSFYRRGTRDDSRVSRCRTMEKWAETTYEWKSCKKKFQYAIEFVRYAPGQLRRVRWLGTSSWKNCAPSVACACFLMTVTCFFFYYFFFVLLECLKQNITYPPTIIVVFSIFFLFRRYFNIIFTYRTHAVVSPCVITLETDNNVCLNTDASRAHVGYCCLNLNKNFRF